ncbi:pyruvate kinase [Humibacillus sp. DSM 29435]|uniref:pyruvate kinase n=1 Tax=Humibacillus sp. DSM 29435 TaxID=1869167 RepID=UPI000873235D|nr:pyruvate kinase [Humibacillus sp. DSM 29435]OFE17697.1 pyruvate kinase [Humibacillus sp. DSM 29435]
MRRAKIVCTIGPQTSSYEQLKGLVDAGMDVARLNLSHGEHAVHEQVYNDVRRASDESGRAVGILVDLQGPKIRTARFRGGPITLAAGQRFIITTRDVDGDETEVGTTYAGLPGDVRPGDVLLIDDGKVMLRAVDVTETDVVTETVIGGVVSNNKGINLPGVAVSVPALSEKDIDDLRFAMKLGADMIALSFVRNAADIDDVHAIMDEFGTRVPVIAKIEKPQAVANLLEIVLAFDGIMVARGDLGVEMPLEEVPLVQKRAIEMARRNAKPVIVATQVLESMIENARPTRAEASDAANAVLDGADALMLSGETSVGAWPIQTVQTMARIIESTEEHGYDLIARLTAKPSTVGGAVTKAAVEVGETIGAKFLIVFSETGDSAQRMARVRPRLPMLVFTSDPRTRSRLALVWGIETFLVPRMHHTDQFAIQVDVKLLPEGRSVEGDLVMIVAGSPPGLPGSTNALRVHRMGDAVNRAAPAYRPEEVTG